MSVVNNDRIRFRSLYDSPIVTVQDYTCHIKGDDIGAEEAADSNSIVLMRHGVFSRHFGKRTVTADVNQAVFFSKDATYRVSHPSDCGDRGTVLTVTPRVLNDIVRELDPTIDEHPQEPFRFVTGPCSTEIFQHHRKLVQRLELAEEQPLEPLWADVTALQLVADVLESSFSQQDSYARPRRVGTTESHADRVEAAREYLAAHFGERISLDQVARAVHTSPFHLARVFQSHTGMPLHRYLTQLRLRAALDQLADDQTLDLTSLALELGFSSHSHFTDAFRKEFGYPPSKVRKRN